MLRAAVPAFLLAAAGLGQAPPTAASVTEPGRTLARPLDVVVGSAPRDADERTLVIVLDPSPTLAGAGFTDAFATAVANNPTPLGQTQLGLLVVGAKNAAVAPTRNHGEVVRAIAASLKQPSDELRNVYATVREAAAMLASRKGDRTLLVVALENGDVEDEVEPTAAALQKAKVRVELLTSEATLADSYWAAHSYLDKPRGTTMTGADGAVIDLPWGWLFQYESANETTPAGFAPWGYSRLAAATGGRVFLHATNAQTAHRCGSYSQCLFCNGDHTPPDDDWNSVLVASVAPFVGSRDESLQAMAKDPCYRAMVVTWRAAAQAGLLRSEPPVKITGTTAAGDRPRAGRDLHLTETAGFARNAKNAEQAAEKAKQLGDALAAELARIPPEQTTPRHTAAAQYTVVMLQLTRVNLLTFAGWCREDAPELFDDSSGEPLPPEVAAIDDDRRPVGIGFSNLGLCHGVKPFYAVELPGGPALRAELERLDALYLGYQARWGRSQFGYALRHNGIARFWPTFPGIAGSLPRVRPKSDNEPKGPVTPRRPPRAGGGSTGAPSGPVTGGGE
ncbi:MAG: hypothetical protein IT455_13270 [Planctomycetes bacterium]|nr:hypothetical protein [Planctomycetota bacterium]